MSKLKGFTAACLVACLSMLVLLTAPASAAEEKTKPQTLTEAAHEIQPN